MFNPACPCVLSVCVSFLITLEIISVFQQLYELNRYFGLFWCCYLAKRTGQVGCFQHDSEMVNQRNPGTLPRMEPRPTIWNPISLLRIYALLKVYKQITPTAI
jgi:hypothetical protein